MTGWLDAFLQRLLEVPAAWVHLTLALAAALENLVPPIPADVVILFGGFLAGQGSISLWVAFMVVWISNVGGALLVYLLGRVYGARFFSGRLGSFILKPQQLTTLNGFYHRYGFTVIFVGRFFPMFRAMVPAFAGVARLDLVRTIVPLALASGLWYGTVLYLGAVAGQNWEQIAAAVASAGWWLYLVALVGVLVLGGWWWRSRHGEENA
ncbi:hypothetical protein BH23GEM3_BH23GEM3_08550 [soil metagenome]|nr:DedA family protein [Gemmatimonadota bacterium]